MGLLKRRFGSCFRKGNEEIVERSHRRDQDNDPSGVKKHCGSRSEPSAERNRATEDNTDRGFDRAAVAEKKRELELFGDLRGRHLSKSIRQKLLLRWPRL